MEPTINGYKLIAIVSLTYALFSCTESANSRDPQVLAKLDVLESKIDTLIENLTAVQQDLSAAQEDLSEVQVAVRSGADGERPCTVDEVISQSLAGCDPGRLPEGVSVSTTYCIQQGRVGKLGATFKLEPELEINLGAGWPNAIWGRLTGNAKLPGFLPAGPIGVPLPNEIAAGGEASLGRGLSICVDIPIQTLAAPEVGQVHALVRGVNESGGKYARRTGRVLNFAARRTPIAEANVGADVVSSKMQFQDEDDSFDIADAAIDRLINGEFAPMTSGSLGTRIFQDGTFQELAGALDVPQPFRDTILDPERIFSAMRTIGQSDMATVCDDFGINAAVRARFPAIENQCDRFAIYPSISNTLEFPDRVSEVRTRVFQMYTQSALHDFICENVSLSVLFNEC